MKALGFERHKLVVQVPHLLLPCMLTCITSLCKLLLSACVRLVPQVTLGQKCGQAQRNASRCLWDPRTDGAASEYYENECLFCICQASALPAWISLQNHLHAQRHRPMIHCRLIQAHSTQLLCAGVRPVLPVKCP